MSQIKVASGAEMINMRKKGHGGSEHIAIGILTIDRFDRETGAFLGCRMKRNQFLNLGAIIEMVAGTWTKPYMANANVVLSITMNADGSGRVYTHKGADVGPVYNTPSNPTNGVRIGWEFWDDTDTARTNLNYAELWVDDPDEVFPSMEFSEALTRVNITAIGGSKPTTENWRYKYDIEFYSTNPNIKTDLHHHWLIRVLGPETSVHPWEANRVRLQPRNVTPANVGTPIVATSAIVGGSPTTGFLEFKFISLAGSNTGFWVTTQIYNNYIGTTWDLVRDGACRQEGSSCGEKGSEDEWEYNWRYTLTGV